MTAQPLIKLHPDDQVAVTTADLARHFQSECDHIELSLNRGIPAGHKVALVPIECGDPVRKYGQVIGIARQDILPGDWVHTDNLANPPALAGHQLATSIPATPPAIRNKTFQGIRRHDGRVATRNYVAVISSVNCSASVSKYVAARFTPDELAGYPNVDGVVAFTHEGGCAMAHGGLKHTMLNRVLAGIAKHPNIGAYVLIGLGCEQASLGFLVEQHQLVSLAAPGDSSAGRPPIFTIQERGGTMATVEAAVGAVAELLPAVNDVRREAASAEHLVVGTECGGSDGNSGITANPAVGIASDRIVAAGGTSVLAETPEIYGAEHLLTRRARTPEIAQQLLERIRWWQWYTEIFGVEMDNNPSQGNKAGGLSTIAEKSLGAVAKGGSTALEAVYEYAEPITAKGLVFMDTPGFDPASVTGMVAGGANIILFTTGRGSCFGCKPVPSIKIATNSRMYHRLSDDMDINAGRVLEGDAVAAVGEHIFDQILEVASGRRTKSEEHGIGQEEFVPWTVGPTL